MSPLQCPQDLRNHRFSFRKENKPNLLPRRTREDFQPVCFNSTTPIPLNQTAVLFPYEPIDNQRELNQPSIGELNQFSSSKLITLPDISMDQPASVTVRQNSLLFPSITKEKMKAHNVLH